jgi:hypothetical protein
MPKPFRSTISAKSIDELSARLGEARDEMPAALIKPFNYYMAIMAALFLLSLSGLLWVLPLALIFSLFGQRHLADSWHWASWFGIGISSLFIVGGLACFKLIAAWQQPLRRGDHLRIALPALCIALLIACVVWLALQPFSSPPTPFDQLRMIGAGVAFIALITWQTSNDVQRQPHSFSTMLQVIGAIALICWITVFVARNAFAIDAANPELWRNFQGILLVIGLLLNITFPSLAKSASHKQDK